MEHPLDAKPTEIALVGLVFSLIVWLSLAVLWLAGTVPIASLTSLVPMLILFQQVGEQVSIVRWYQNNYAYSLGHTVKLIGLGLLGKGIVPRSEAALPTGMLIVWCGSVVGLLTFLGLVGSNGTLVALGSMIVFEVVLFVTLWRHR